MSGGSYEYAYRHVEEFAEAIRGKSVLRDAFADHLELVARAMHDIEWVDDDDYGEGDDDEPIRAVLSPCAELSTATSAALSALDVLTAAIARAGESKP